ncbi:hypothetical protein MKW94_025632 [Papaver nudicaule]|uniref:DUF3615 domain-containing protein n=1 Tax=Papaver nudicaule TaxID=74823 RepID=A0AA41SAM8_PAPNU|nr:hypothetical protein [Papaver nudicaule]
MVVLRSSKDTSSSSSSNSKWGRGRVSYPSFNGFKRLPSIRKPPSRDLKWSPKQCRDHVRPYATEAMNFYNTEMGTKYKLVEPGYITSAILPTCFLFHIDFTAKKIDVAGAPVEMFFAELTEIKQVRCVKFCTSMGPKKMIAGDKNNGCLYCEFHNVQHPLGGGFMAGGGGLFTDEKLVEKQEIKSEQIERYAEMTTRQPLYR